MNRKMRHVASVAALFFASSMAWATTPDTPIATINARKILSDAKVAKDLMARFQADFRLKDQELQGVASALKEKTAEFERLGPSLAPSQLTERQGQLDFLARELKRKKQQLMEDRDARKREDIQHVFNIATMAVKQIAEGAHIDMVFQDVVYANPRTDITAKVIEVMNANSGQ